MPMSALGTAEVSGARVSVRLTPLLLAVVWPLVGGELAEGGSYYRHPRPPTPPDGARWGIAPVRTSLAEPPRLPVLSSGGGTDCHGPVAGSPTNDRRRPPGDRRCPRHRHHKCDRCGRRARTPAHVSVASCQATGWLGPDSATSCAAACSFSTTISGNRTGAGRHPPSARRRPLWPVVLSVVDSVTASGCCWSAMSSAMSSAERVRTSERRSVDCSAQTAGCSLPPRCPAVGGQRAPPPPPDRYALPPGGYSSANTFHVRGTPYQPGVGYRRQALSDVA